MGKLEIEEIELLIVFSLSLSSFAMTSLIGLLNTIGTPTPYTLSK